MARSATRGFSKISAVALYLAGTDGRLTRSLKSLLGSSLVQRHTAVGWGELRVQGIIARFLGELAERAHASLGTEAGA